MEEHHGRVRNDHYTVVAPVMTDPPTVMRRVVLAMAAILLATTALSVVLALSWGVSLPVVLLVGVFLLGWLPGLETLRRQLRDAETVRNF